MKKITNSEMAGKFIRQGNYTGAFQGCCAESIRAFAKWLTKADRGLPALPATVEVRKGCLVQVSEQQGRVEVVFWKDGQRIRLLGDQDGIHVGTLVKD